MYLEFLWLLFLATNSLVSCITFPADSKKSVVHLQTLIDQMTTADAWAPNPCENILDLSMDLQGAKAPRELIHLKWYQHTEDEVNNGELGKFKNAFDSYYSKPQGTDVFRTYLGEIYDSGPFQALVAHFRVANHRFFFNRNQAQITQAMVDIWEPFTTPGAFKHVFFGEGRNDGSYSGLHSWYGYYLIQSEQYIEFVQKHKSINEVGAQIAFNWKKSKGSPKVRRKPVSSMLLNHSPAFEFSLYTALLLLYSNEPKTIDPKHPNTGVVKTNFYRIQGCQMRFLITYSLNDNKTPRRLITIYPEKYGGNHVDCDSSYNERVAHAVERVNTESKNSGGPPRLVYEKKNAHGQVSCARAS